MARSGSMGGGLSGFKPATKRPVDTSRAPNFKTIQPGTGPGGMRPSDRQPRGPIRRPGPPKS